MALDDTDELAPLPALGCIPQPRSTRAALPRYDGPRINPADYYSTDYMRQFVPMGKSQKSVPACCAYATGKIWQLVYRLRTGKPAPDVSYCALYEEATGGNFNEGTMPLDLIRRMQRDGIPPATAALPEWFDSARRIPAESQAARKMLRADEWQECHTRDDVISAILSLRPVNVCMQWRQADSNPGPTGRLKLNAGRVLGGHSLVGCGIVMGYSESPSGVGILLNNHHGDSKVPAQRDERGNLLTYPVWGDDGFGVVPIERVEEDMESFGSFALSSVMVRSEDLDVPEPHFAG